MCFNFSVSKDGKLIQNKFYASFKEKKPHHTIFHTNGFKHESIFILKQNQTDFFDTAHWGLIPFWVKDQSMASIIRTQTLNARAETVYEKASFKHLLQSKRCIIPADGFFDTQELKKEKIPYYIQLEDEDLFAFAGLWDQWKDAENNILQTFTIITTAANPFMENIHNIKKRMPVILKPNEEKKWLENDLNQNDIQDIIEESSNRKFKAHPVSKLLFNKTQDTNIPQVQEPIEIENKPIQGSLF